LCSGCKKQTQYSTKHAKQQGVTIILLKRLFLILLQNIFILFYLKISCLLCAILAYVKYLCSSCKMSPRTTSLCGYIIFRYFTSGSTSSTRASVGGGGVLSMTSCSTISDRLVLFCYLCSNIGMQTFGINKCVKLILIEHQK